MKNANSQNINLNQSVPAVVYDVYQWWRKIAYTGEAYTPHFPDDATKDNFNRLGYLLEKILTDFKPQNKEDQNIKLKTVVDMLHDEANPTVADIDLSQLDGQGQMMYQIASQLLHRGQ